MTVSDVLRDRMQEPTGFQRTAMLSLGAHVVALTMVFLAPGSWWLGDTEPPPTIMMLTLGGGGEGPINGGMTTMGGRPVQVQTPPEEIKRPEPIRPPAAATPAMTLPAPNARSSRTPPSRPVQAPDDARGRTPTTGAATSEGSTSAATSVRGRGFGLSTTGGGPGVGSTLDVADFCCPDYLNTMAQRITANWNQRQGADGLVRVKFTIRRDGLLQDIMLEESSRNPILDLAAQRAIIDTRQLPPLPAEYPNPTLGVHLYFQYQR